MHSEDSPRHSFSVEEYASDSGTSVWLRTREGRLAQLYTRPGSPIEPFVYISPDERWIVCVQKLYHGASAAWLYERSAPLEYKEIMPSPFSDAAWDFFRHETRSGFTQTSHFMIHTGGWSADSHSLLVELSGDDGKTIVSSWYCHYDLQKHRFYLDATLRAKNKNVICPKKET